MPREWAWKWIPLELDKWMGDWQPEERLASKFFSRSRSVARWRGSAIATAAGVAATHPSEEYLLELLKLLVQSFSSFFQVVVFLEMKVDIKKREWEGRSNNSMIFFHWGRNSSKRRLKIDQNITKEREERGGNRSREKNRKERKQKKTEKKRENRKKHRTQAW